MKCTMIEYPIEVSKIEFGDEYGLIEIHGGKLHTGSFVAVRPCGEEYGDKTYLGVYLGESPVGMGASWNHESKELKIHVQHNPAMFVPDLNRIIYGRGSWWRRIDKPADLEKITDKDINNVWYVQALKALETAPGVTENET